MKHKLLTAILSILIVLSMPGTALAQDYFFSLDREVVNVYWNADGTLSLDYLFTFTNQPGGHAIEFVDVGTPNSNFDFNRLEADLDGRPLSISSDYQGEGSGFAVEMGSAAIQPGETGTVHVYIGRVSRVLYTDDDDSNYASAVFAPTYFGSQYVTGETDLTVTFHLPPGVQPQEPRWHAAPAGFPSEPETALDEEGRVTYTWRNPNADASRQYRFGASFPKTDVPADSIVTVQLPSISISPDAIFGLLCLGFFGFMFLGIPILGVIAGNRRKLQYMSPRIAIEGHGIKRGLTAVEAAILMQQPLDKVMTMILFGVVKKNAATVKTRDPLELDIADPFLKSENLHAYEKNFLRAFKTQDKQKRRSELQSMIVASIKSVSEKMKGFSRRETVDYYKNIMEKAWAQVQAANTPEVQSKMFEEALEWTMLDPEYDDRTRRVFTGPVFVPTWWPRYDPTWHGGRSVPTTIPTSVPSSSRGGPTALPGADFAASVVTGVQTFSQNVIGNVNEFTSRVTNLTNPPPPPPRRSGGRPGGTGRSCACACACAGCACACAGGGR